MIITEKTFGRTAKLIKIEGEKLKGEAREENFLSE